MRRREFLARLGRLTSLGLGAALLPPGMSGFARAEDPFSMGIQAQNLINSKKYREAIPILRSAVPLDPKSDWLHGLLGRAYFGAGMYSEALEEFKEAVRLNPEDTFSRMHIDMIRVKPVERRKPDKTFPDLERRAVEEEQLFRERLQSAGKTLDFQVERIVLDPGHGGFDPGAVGKTGLKEKDVTLSLVRRLKEKLDRSGKFRVFATREDDYYVSLGERTATANQRKADLFVSFHVNAAGNPKAKGSETFYCSETASDKEAAKLAEYENSVIRFDQDKETKPGFLDVEAILFQVERKLYWEDSKHLAHRFQGKFGPDTGLHDRGVKYANFYVLREARMPSLLVESGFISNPSEEELLTQERFQEELSNVAFQSILRMSGK